jgi:protein XagA
MALTAFRAALGLLFLPLSGQCGAWPQLNGVGEVIVTLEQAKAQDGFDDKGQEAKLVGDWAQDSLFLYSEYGLTDRVTLHAKTYVQDYKTITSSYRGFGSLELGGRYSFYKGRTSVLAVGASLEGLGRGRRNDFDPEAVDRGTDSEIRLYGGHAFKLKGFKFKGFKLVQSNAFADLQLARKFREKFDDQNRLDISFGIKPTQKWLILSQIFAGETLRKDRFKAYWAHQDISLVRHLGVQSDVSLQVGVRQTLMGQNVPKVKSVSLALWRRF